MEAMNIYILATVKKPSKANPGLSLVAFINLLGFRYSSGDRITSDSFNERQPMTLLAKFQSRFLQ